MTKITETQITDEMDRLRDQYQAYTTDAGATPSEEELHTWCEDNLIEQSIITDAAKAEGIDPEAYVTKISEVPEIETEEARAFYKERKAEFINPERVHAQHIVLHNDRHESAEATVTLLNLRNQINDGTISWEDAVKDTTECQDQSDLGFFARGEMVEAFEDVAFALEEGAISDVVETPFGWHLLRVVSHLPEEPALFEEVKEMIVDHLTKEARQAKLDAHLDPLIAGYKVTHITAK